VIVGGCVTILPNVTIGEDSVIAAGSVVTKDVLPQTVVKGNPARAMMTRKEYELKRKEFINSKRKNQTAESTRATGM
jgi:acetyltransferase-like isoleucine patch superfamily enzyme